MNEKIPGLHHVTAIAADPQRTVDFYVQVLGLRLVKQTVNFDDPSAYHLYFGDDLGRPGTALTFFSWPNTRAGQPGSGQVSAVAFSAPAESLGFWRDRLTAQHIAHHGPVRVFDEEVLSLADPDGLLLELVAHAGPDERPGWQNGPLPGQYALRGFHGVTLAENDEATTPLLAGMGFERLAQAGNRLRYTSSDGSSGSLVDLHLLPAALPGRMGAGAVHHIAWRTPDGESQLAWRAALTAMAVPVTRVMNRVYFHSIYFREPGGMLFEIATDGPGFTVDEPASRLGSRLALPPWMEAMRRSIEVNLPALAVPVVALRK